MRITSFTLTFHEDMYESNENQPKHIIHKDLLTIPWYYIVQYPCSGPNRSFRSLYSMAVNVNDVSTKITPYIKHSTSSFYHLPLRSHQKNAPPCGDAFLTEYHMLQTACAGNLPDYSGIFPPATRSPELPAGSVTLSSSPA